MEAKKQPTVRLHEDFEVGQPEGHLFAQPQSVSATVGAAPQLLVTSSHSKIAHFDVIGCATGPRLARAVTETDLL